MALNFSVDEAAMQIKDNGFCLIRDPTIVSAFDEMIQTHSPFRFSDEKGFKFWRDNIHTDPVSESGDVLNRADSNSVSVGS
jgi:hypothetical protein